jgi:DNA-binding protein H-NS
MLMSGILNRPNAVSAISRSLSAGHLLRPPQCNPEPQGTLIMSKEAKIIRFPTPGTDVGTMQSKKSTLDALSNQALCKLRDEIAEELKNRAEGLQREIDRLVSPISPANTERQGGPKKGNKVAPKYQGPNGETWSGRGKNPRWLAAAISEGKRSEDFLIGKPKKKNKFRVLG